MFYSFGVEEHSAASAVLSCRATFALHLKALFSKKENLSGAFEKKLGQQSRSFLRRLVMPDFQGGSEGGGGGDLLAEIALTTVAGVVLFSLDGELLFVDNEP